MFVELCVYQVSSQLTLISPSALLSFDKVHLYQSLNCELYDPITSTLRITQPGLYWFHLSVGIPAYTAANSTIVGLNNTIGVMKTNTAYKDDQVAIDGLSWISSKTSLFVSTANKLYSSNSSVGETAWLWLRLDTAMQQLVAFYVVKTNTAQSTPNGGKVTYDKIIINEGNGWNKSSNTFMAPVSGYYFISYGTAASSGVHYCMQLALNSIIIEYNCVFETTVHNGLEISRATVMVHLNINDTIATFTYLNLLCLGCEYSSYVYLQSFLYNPASSPIKWLGLSVVSYRVSGGH